MTKIPYIEFSLAPVPDDRDCDLDLGSVTTVDDEPLDVEEETREFAECLLNYEILATFKGKVLGRWKLGELLDR